MRFAPEVYTAKVQESKAFYCDLLGFRVKKELEGFVVLQHAKYAEYEILFCVPDSPFVQDIFHPAYSGQGIIWQIEVDDIIAEYNRLRYVAPVALELIEEPENGKHFAITDPNGILIDIVQYT